MKRAALLLACALAAGCTTLAPGYVNLTLENLFNAERSFARAAAVKGARASFIDNFAAEAIIFQPGPVRYADFIRSHPAPADPLATLLEWGPQAGAVSHAGDLGFTTGPTRFSTRNDPRADVRHGYYFSVWTRASGEWKVLVDAGVPQTIAPPQEGIPNMRAPIWRQPDPALTDAQRSANRDALLAMERLPRSFGAVGGAGNSGAAAYADLLTPSSRLLRSDQPLLVGKALADYAAAQPATLVEWTPVDGAIAVSDDLAYTYGRSRRTAGTAPPVDGYYVHVWQRDTAGAWKLLTDVSLPGG
jgi:ketosteroid isomerase-like protein